MFTFVTSAMFDCRFQLRSCVVQITAVLSQDTATWRYRNVTTSPSSGTSCLPFQERHFLVAILVKLDVLLVKICVRQISLVGLESRLS